MAGGANIGRPVIDIGYPEPPDDGFVIDEGGDDGVYAEESTSTYIEGGNPVLVNPKGNNLTGNISLTDAELGAVGNGIDDWRGAVVRIQRHVGNNDLIPNPDDVFGFDFDEPALTPVLTIAGNAILHNGSAVATFSNVDGLSSIHFDGNNPVSTELANFVVSRVTYANTSDNTSAVELAYVIFDGTPGAPNTKESEPAYVSLDIWETNDAPSIIASDRIPVLANDTARLIGIVLNDPDSAAVPLTITLSVDIGTLTAANSGDFGYEVIVTGSGSNSITLTSPLEEANKFLAAGRVSFTNPGNTNATLTITVSDGGA
jgi:hypothetical protein